MIHKKALILLMIMTLSLLVYPGLEHKIRKQLGASEAFFPNMVKNKNHSKPDCSLGVFKVREHRYARIRRSAVYSWNACGILDNIQDLKLVSSS